MPLDEEFLRARLDLRARRARNRSLIPDDRPPQGWGAAPHPGEQAEFEDQTGVSIIGLGTIAGMVT
jgi:hypothetical protein